MYGIYVVIINGQWMLTVVTADMQLPGGNVFLARTCENYTRLGWLVSELTPILVRNTETYPSMDARIMVDMSLEEFHRRFPG